MVTAVACLSAGDEVSVQAAGVRRTAVTLATLGSSLTCRAFCPYVVYTGLPYVQVWSDDYYSIARFCGERVRPRRELTAVSMRANSVGAQRTSSEKDALRRSDAVHGRRKSRERGGVASWAAATET